MSTSYLTLVNRAIEEAGVRLDALTSGNFASTTDSMQIKFKRWVADAWKDIQTMKRGWHYMRKKGVYILQPRLEFYDGSATDETTFDNAYIADTNDNWEYTVNGTVYVESGTFVAGTATGWFNIEDEDGLLPISDPVKTTDYVDFSLSATIVFDTFNLYLLTPALTFVQGFPPGSTVTIGAYTGTVVSSSEAGNDYTLVLNFTSSANRTAALALLSATPTTQVVSSVTDPDNGTVYVTDRLSSSNVTGSMRITGWGRYNLDTTGEDSSADSGVSDLQEIDVNSVLASPYSGEATTDYSTQREFTSVRFLSPYEFLTCGFANNKPLGQPSYYTIDADGKYSFYPQPDKAYALTFNYWKTPQGLSAHGDLVEGISDYYTEAIVWLAVHYWAEFDENSSKMNKADRRFMKYYQKMLRDYLEGVHFPPGVGEASFG